MKILILAAGFGTRLKPLTDHIPKALISVCGTTLLQRNIEFFQTRGFDSIAVNAHSHPEQIFAYQAQSQIPITVLHEQDRIRGTGGALYFARDYLGIDDSFCVSNVDILSNVDVAAVVSRFLESESICSLVATPADRKGTIYYDSGSMEYHGTPATRKVVDSHIAAADFIGMAMYKKKALDYVTAEDFSVIPVWERLQHEGYTVSVAVDESIRWVDTGTPRDLAHIHFAALEGKITLPIDARFTIDLTRRCGYPTGLKTVYVDQCGPYTWIDSTDISLRSAVDHCIIYDGSHIEPGRPQSYCITSCWGGISFETSPR